MTFDAILKAIEQSAKAERKTIAAEAEAEADRLLVEARAQAERLVAEAERVAQSDAEDLRRRAISAVALEVTKATAAGRDGVTREVLEGAREAIAGLPAKDRTPLLTHLLEVARGRIDAGEVAGNAADREVLASSGFATFRAVEGLGGFVASDPASGISVDCRFETILADVWRDAKRSAHATLFPGE